jgi:hypothetical protein
MLNPQFSTSCRTTLRRSCMRFIVFSRSPTSSFETTSISLSSLPAATAWATSIPCASGRVTTRRMNRKITNSIGRVSNTAARTVCMRWRATAALRLLQRNLHADRTEDGALRHEVAHHAVLAQVVLLRQRGPNDPECLLAVGGDLDRGILLAGGEHLTFQRIVFAFLLRPGPNCPVTASPRRTRTSRMLGNCLIWSMNTSRCGIVPVTIMPVSPASTMSWALRAKSCACSIAAFSLTCAVHRIMTAQDAMVMAPIETIRRTQIFWLPNFENTFLKAPRKKSPP